MTREEANLIIEKEELKRLNWYDEKNLRENQVGIKYENGQWLVYATDERASIVDASVSTFKTEEEALVMFIRKARNGKIIFG